MSVPAAKIDALGSRYGSLFQALFPDLRGLVLVDAELRRRSEWGDAPAAIDTLVQATGWQTAVPEKSAALGRDLGAQCYLLLQPLIADSARFLGAIGLIFPSPAPAEMAAARARLGPAFECLRQEISASDAAARATELQLLRTANQLELDYEEGASLEQLLDASLRRAGGELAMLLVPNRGIMVVSQLPRQLSPSVAEEFSGMRERLRSLSGQLRRPLLMNGPAARSDRSARCRMLIVPQRCCHGRVETLLAYLNPIEAAPFGAYQTLMLQAGGAAIVRRLEADMDRTTGLLNRTGLEEILRRVKLGVGSLILIDIDRLHAVNELRGFEAGDQLIVQVADLLKPPLLPQGAHAVRLFGGCFAALVPGVDGQAAANLAIKIQNAVGEFQSATGAQSGAVTVSCGVAEISRPGEPLAKAFIAAEMVLKLAKERGRSRVEVHASESATIIRRHGEASAAADLREALRTREVLIYAQKIVSLKDSGAPLGFELLVRIRDPQTGEIRAPKEFIDAAQRYQLLPAVDRYVVDTALALLSPHRSLLGRQSTGISINVSGQSVCDPAFIDHFIKKLRESRLPPAAITIEVTEQAAVTNLAQAADMMRRLREAGCGIALDDFGTGASSLAYLRSLPATRIKIDGSFVKDILSNPRSDAAVRGIAQLAHNFKLDSVAEFVETQAVADKLRQIGIDKGQGYFFGKPEPLEKALADLQERESAELFDILQAN